MQTRKMYFCKSRCLLAQYRTMKNKRKILGDIWSFLRALLKNIQEMMKARKGQNCSKFVNICLLELCFIQSLSPNEMDIHLEIPCFVLSKLQIFIRMYCFDKIKEGQVETYQMLRTTPPYCPFLTSRGSFYMHLFQAYAKE